MDLPALLQQLPPGKDLFDFLAETVNEQVYPDLGRVFSVQVYLVTTLCCLVIAIILSGLFIRWYKGRLRFFVADGPATRLSPALFVPLLWLVSGICMVIHTFWLRSSIQNRHLTFSIGMFWWLVACGVTASYAVISTSVMCSAPIVRRGLMRLDAGHLSSKLSPAFIVLNSATVAVALLAVGTAIVPAKLQGEAFQTVHRGYSGLQTLIAQAKATQNVAVLASAGMYADILAEAQDKTRRTIVVGGAVYSSHIVVFFFFGLIPALFLNVHMRKRIDRLDKGLDVSSQQYTGSLTSASIVPVQLPFRRMPSSSDENLETLADGVSQPVRRSRVELPKDRPFANLAPTSSLPQTYATILRARVDPQEKAKRLRAALRRDNIQLLAYFLMLASMGTLAFFHAAKGPWHFDTKKQFVVAYTWEMWSYLAPALILAVTFLWDALSTSSPGDDADMPATSFSSRNFQAPALNSVQLSQMVEVVEEHQLEEKTFASEKRSMYGNFGRECP